MAITPHIDQPNDLTIFKATGVLRFEEVMSVVRAFYGGDPTKNVLWDLIDITEIQLTSEEVEKIATFSPRYEGNRPSGKTAFVAQEDILFGLSRMFGTLSDIHGAPHYISVFRSIEEALQWFDKP